MEDMIWKKNNNQKHEIENIRENSSNSVLYSSWKCVDYELKYYIDISKPNNKCELLLRAIFVS